MDVATFRGVFPEFGDTTAYPDARIAFALQEASLRLLPQIWGELRDSGIAYYVAHRLALAGATKAATSSGGQASTGVLPAPGIVTSKAVGSVSKSMDVSVGSVDGAGDFNLTLYGREYASLAATIAVGVMQF